MKIGLTGYDKLAKNSVLPKHTFIGKEKLYEKYPQIRKQFSDNHILLLYTTDPYFLITTKKQVKTLEDIRGLKIRMMGGPSTEMMKKLGMPEPGK